VSHDLRQLRFNHNQPTGEIDMSRQYGSPSWRKKLERILAGLAFVSMTALVIGGTAAMCLPGGTLA
jgi:hypothetical protein